MYQRCHHHRHCSSPPSLPPPPLRPFSLHRTNLSPPHLEKLTQDKHSSALQYLTHISLGHGVLHQTLSFCARVTRLSGSAPNHAAHFWRRRDRRRLRIRVVHFQRVLGWKVAMPPPFRSRGCAEHAIVRQIVHLALRPSSRAYTLAGLSINCDKSQYT